MSVYLRRRVRSVRTSATHELGSSFSRIRLLPLLETINLKFFPAHGPQLDSDNEGRLALQASILSALAASSSFRAPPKLIPFSLHNLSIWDLTPLDSFPLQAVLKTLWRVQLSYFLTTAQI